MKHASALLVGISMVFCAILSIGLAQTQEGWEVTGTVTTDSGPVKGAVVSISGASYVPGVRTDGQGSYSLKGVVPGRYSVSIQKMDNTSVPQSRTLTLTGGMRLKVDFRIPKGGVISGRVLDENKQPVRDMVVHAMSKTISGDRPTLREQGVDLTNDLGEYRIPHLPDGAYALAVDRKQPLPMRKRASGPGPTPGRGYPPITFYPGTRVPDAAAVLDVRSGGEQTGLDIVLRKQSTLCVSFKAGGGWETRASAALNERLRGYEPTVAQGGADANASSEICGVAPGEYRLHLQKISVDQDRHLQVHGYQMAAFTMDKENVDLGTLEPLAQADIRGTVSVKDASGDSVPAGLYVSIVASEMQRVYTGRRPEQVKPDGTFVLSNMFMGEYGVQVTGLPAGYYVIDASQQGRSVLERGLWPGNGDLRITLGTDGPSVTGKVLTADGAAIPDAPILLIPQESGQHLVAKSDQTGAYRFSTEVRPGKYRVVAVSDSMEWQLQDTATATRLAANGTELELGPRQARTVDLKIQSAR